MVSSSERERESSSSRDEDGEIKDRKGSEEDAGIS